jgi:hypothetical protein
LCALRTEMIRFIQFSSEPALRLWASAFTDS